MQCPTQSQLTEAKQLNWKRSTEKETVAGARNDEWCVAFPHLHLSQSGGGGLTENQRSALTRIPGYIAVAQILAE